MKKSIWAFCLLGSQMMLGQVHFRLAPFYGDAFYSKEGKLEFMTLVDEKSPRAADVADFINNNVLNDGPCRVTELRSENDELGFTHIRYNILYNNVPVANKQIVAHIKGGKLVSLNGDLHEVLKPVNQPVLSEDAALAAALKKVNATHYMWENKAEEAHMRQALEDPNFSYQPTGSREIIEKDGSFHHAWKFNIYADAPLYRANVFVDATSGNVLDEQNLICTADVPGSAVTKYSGTQTITVDFNGTNYRLKETGRGMGVETYNMNGSTNNYAGATNFVNSTPNWTITTNDQGATDAHWGAEKTYDYYWLQHGRNSINNAGFKLLSYIHYGANYTNAFWDGQRMSYGDGNINQGMKIFTTLDICGHEITHGLTSNSSALVYQNESGALNESFSDIFGACIENYGRPTNWNWKIGEDMVFGGLRDMSNPNSFGDPDCYGGTGWYVGTNDNGGVHTNSGVSNFWFYLLTQGASGVNDFNNSYNISGIGFVKSGKIAFRGLTFYFTSGTNYASARALTIQAAKDLYGNCSNEVTQTTNAWYAVGVGSQFNPLVVGANFLATNSNYCSVPSAVSFTNLTSNGGIYFWDFGDGTSSTSTNPVHTYTAPGAYTVKLKATGCNNLTDSIKHLGLVTINVPQAPSVSNITGCENTSATLTALGTGNINWFPSNLSTQAVGTGTSYITPPLNANATYWAANTATSPAVVGGPNPWTNGGYMNNNTHYIVFDVLQNCMLNSFEVDCQTAGTRVFQLKNSSGTVVNSWTKPCVVGVNVIQINQSFAPGTGYRLGLSSASTSFMYRTNSNVTYPYALGNTIKITGSSLAGNYFWFYNWDVAKNECSSTKVPLTINVMPNPTVSASAPISTACMDDADIQLTGNPSGGLFAGSGVNGAFFTPTVGTGLYPVHYIYTDGNGCSGIDSTVVMTIEACTGLNKTASSKGIQVYPNPASDFVTIANNSGSNGNITVIDAVGRVVLQGKIEESTNVNIATFANGLYIIRLTDNKGENLSTTRFVKD